MPYESLIRQEYTLYAHLYLAGNAPTSGIPVAMYAIHISSPGAKAEATISDLTNSDDETRLGSGAKCFRGASRKEVRIEAIRYIQRRHPEMDVWLSVSWDCSLG